MIAVRILARAEWEPRLHKLKCKRHEGAIRLRTAEVWETEHGRLFTVPMDNADGRLRADDLQEVAIQVAKLKPLDIND